MNLEINEISLSAYALGELTGAERAAVAAHLVSSEVDRRYVADVRATAHLLGDELARESFGGLTDLQHAAIENKLMESMRIFRARPRISRAKRWDRAVFAMSLAASIMIVCGVTSVLMPFVYRHIDVTMLAHRMSQTPVVHNAVKPLPFSNHDANEADVDAAPEPQSVPRPDNWMAVLGSGHEVTSQPDESADARPAEVEKTNPRGVAASVSADRTVASKAAPGANGPANASKPLAKRDTFASIPANAKSPDRSRTNVGSSANGALPTGEQYVHLLENPYIDPAVEPVSGFSAGVDTASYSNIRRYLTHGTLPPRDAVRIEEMLNYFPTRSATLPPGDEKVVLQVELGACPWRPEARLARICLQARDLPTASRPPVNLVFVIDTSDSMRKEKTKLPLLKQAIRRLVGGLTVSDRVSLVSYSHEAQVVLPPTVADDKQDIWAAVDRLETGGTMIGGQGIEVAYDLASRNILRGGINRIVLATDGNFNVGTSSRSDITHVVAAHAREKVSLTVLGVGMENLKDGMLAKLARAGNGSYAYIDTLAEARKVLDDQVNGALVTVADDVKVQVKFNPASAGNYRLLGYERRALSKDELNSQSRAGGEIGAGQSVTALYEVLLPSKAPANRPINMVTATATFRDPDTNLRETLVTVGEDHATALPRTSPEFRFAAAVVEFGLMLRNSDYKENASYSSVVEHAANANGPDETGYRREFMALIQKAKTLAANR